MTEAAPPAEAVPVVARRSFLSSAATYVVANIANAAIPFLLLPVLTRVLSPEDYGTVAMFATVIAIVSTLTGLSVHGAVGVRYFQQDRYDLRRYVTTCLLILACSTAVVLAGVTVLGPWLEQVTAVPRRWLVVAVLVSGAQFVVQIRLTLWQVAGEAMRYAVLQVTQSALNAGLSLLLVLNLGWAWEGRTGGQSIAVACAGLAAFISLSRGRWTNAPPSRAYVRDALLFGVPLIPHTIGGFMSTMVDRVLITNILSVEQTGIYLVGVQIALVLGLLTDSFNRAYAPWLFGVLSRGEEQRKPGIVRRTYGYFALVLVAAVVLGVAAPWLLGIVVGERFRRAADVVLLLAIAQAFGGMYLMVTNYVFYASRTAHLASITFAGGVVNVALSWFLIRRNGAMGAAQSLVVTQALVFLATWMLAQRSYPMPWKSALVRR